MFRIAIAFVVLTLAQMLTGMLIPLPFPAKEGVLPWLLAANALVACVTGWLALRGGVTGWRLFAVVFGVMYFNSVIEALFFGFFGPRVVFSLLAMSALSTAIFVPVFGFKRPESRWLLTLPRLAIGAAAYLVVYFTAGLIVFPFVEQFYTTMRMPTGLQVIAVQLLVRGPIFVALCAIIVSTTRTTRTETILMTGCTLSCLGGVAPLMVPNALFPDAVRWAHFIEVTTSNFAYGCFVAALLQGGPSPRVRGEGPPSPQKSHGDASAGTGAGTESLNFTPRLRRFETAVSTTDGDTVLSVKNTQSRSSS